MNEIVNLDKIDRRILFELERNARIPDVKLAKLTGKSKDAIRYRIKRLEEQKVITGYKTWIDMSKLGYQSGTIYMTLLNLPDKKKKLIDFIMNNPRTYWIGVAEGVWNIGMSPYFKSNEELFKIKHELMAKFGSIITDIKITSLVGVSVHEKSFLFDEKTKLTSFTEKVEEIKLDDISKQILRKIYWNARENFATLADELEVSVDIIRKRIKDMEMARIIIRYSSVIDYQKIGFEYHKAFVYLKKLDSSFIKKMEDFVEGSRKIINMVRQIAPWDFELILFTKSFAEYDEAIGELASAFSGNIQKIESATMSVDIIFPCQKLPLI